MMGNIIKPDASEFEIVTDYVFNLAKIARATFRFIPYIFLHITQTRKSEVWRGENWFRCSPAKMIPKKPSNRPRVGLRYEAVWRHEVRYNTLLPTLHLQETQMNRIMCYDGSIQTGSELKRSLDELNGASWLVSPEGTGEFQSGCSVSPSQCVYDAFRGSRHRVAFLYAQTFIPPLHYLQEGGRMQCLLQVCKVMLTPLYSCAQGLTITGMHPCPHFRNRTSCRASLGDKFTRCHWSPRLGLWRSGTRLGYKR